MPRVGTIPDEFWDSAPMQAAQPEIAYLGPMPQIPSLYYALDSLFPAAGWGPSAFVYLLLGCDGATLYAGKARRPGNRFDKHRRQKDWWEEVTNLLLIRVTGHTVEEADTLALHVEGLCIHALDPTYNIAGVHRRPPGIPRGEYAR